MIDTKGVKTNSVIWHIIFFAALVFFIILSLKRIQQPVTQDELNWLIAAETYYKDSIPRHLIYPDTVVVYSPYLYLYCIVTAFKVFGESVCVARLPGIFSGIIAIVMVFYITKSLSHGNRVERVKWATVSSLLYAATPAVIQGSAIIDIDNTVLVPAVLFLYLSFVKYQQKKNYTWAMLAGLALSIALWGRITTPPIAALLLSFYFLASKNEWKTKLMFFGSLLCGVLFFVISWYLYCAITDIPFSGTFVYTWTSFQGKSSDFTFSQLLQNMIYVILWIGIFPAIVFVIIIIQRCGRYLKRPEICTEDVFLWSGAVLVAGYTLVDGLICGFPKYHSPAIPLLCIYVGIFLSQSGLKLENIQVKAVTITVIIIASAFVVQNMVTGDLLYIFRYTLRNAMAFSLPLFPVLKSMVLKTGLYFTIFALLFVICLRIISGKAWFMLLILFSLGTIIGTSLQQNSATYHTGYNYGGEGTIEAAQYIREKVPLQSVVYAPSEVIYYLKLPNSLYLRDHFWTDRDNLRKRLADKHTSALAYNTATNTIQQIRTISSDKKIQQLLNRDYYRKKIKSYVVWIRQGY